MRGLEEPYRSRAVPPGTLRFWSWLFAARQTRDSLLGIYALTAEWRALMDPATASEVAQLKLQWWREELRRWDSGSPLHPITRYLAGLPHAAAADLKPLEQSVEAASAQVAGAPLTHAVELESHAAALYGIPLLMAARLDGGGERGGLDACVAALAAAKYLARACTDYGREARAGRIHFAVDELIAAGIENDDLLAGEAPPRLQEYLEQLRLRAAGYFARAATALDPPARPGLRHLQVLAELGAKRPCSRECRSGADFRPSDLYTAWKAARRAAAAAAR